MRLIDADALKQQVEFAQEHTWPEDLAFQVPKMIDNAPTIDAIPVEWLNDKELNSERELSYAAWQILSEWRQEQNEQEAR